MISSTSTSRKNRSLTSKEKKSVEKVDEWKYSVPGVTDSNSLMNPDEVLELFADVNYDGYNTNCENDMKVLDAFLWMADILPDLRLESKYLNNSGTEFKPDANEYLVAVNKLANIFKEELLLEMIVTNHEANNPGTEIKLAMGKGERNTGAALNSVVGATNCLVNQEMGLSNEQQLNSNRKREVINLSDAPQLNCHKNKTLINSTDDQLNCYNKEYLVAMQKRFELLENEYKHKREYQEIECKEKLELHKQKLELQKHKLELQKHKLELQKIDHEKKMKKEKMELEQCDQDKIISDLEKKKKECELQIAVKKLKGELTGKRKQSTFPNTQRKKKKKKPQKIPVVSLDEKDHTGREPNVATVQPIKKCATRSIEEFLSDDSLVKLGPDQGEQSPGAESEVEEVDGASKNLGTRDVKRKKRQASIYPSTVKTMNRKTDEQTLDTSQVLENSSTTPIRLEEYENDGFVVPDDDEPEEEFGNPNAEIDVANITIGKRTRRRTVLYEPEVSEPEDDFSTDDGSEIQEVLNREVDDEGDDDYGDTDYVPEENDGPPLPLFLGTLSKYLIRVNGHKPFACLSWLKASSQVRYGISSVNLPSVTSKGSAGLVEGTDFLDNFFVEFNVFFDIILAFGQDEEDESKMPEYFRGSDAFGSWVSVHLLETHGIASASEAEREVVAESIRLYYPLRLLLSHPRNNVSIEFVTEAPGSIRSARYNFLPESDVVYRGRFVVPNYPEAEAEYVVYRRSSATTPETLGSSNHLQSEFREYENLVVDRERGVVYDFTVFKSYLSTHDQVENSYGVLDCPHMTTLLHAWENGSNGSDPKNPILMLDPARVSGLAVEHLFLANLFSVAAAKYELILQKALVASSQGLAMPESGLLEIANKLSEIGTRFVSGQTEIFQWQSDLNEDVAKALRDVNEQYPQTDAQKKP
eukprot:jgi/Bigna1/76424/fgenesh1_pg.41_\